MAKPTKTSWYLRLQGAILPKRIELIAVLALTGIATLLTPIQTKAATAIVEFFLGVLARR